VLRTNLPGHGGIADPGPDYSLRTDWYVEALLDLLDRKGADRIHFIGEGLGGALGINFAARHPERMATLTAVSVPLSMKERGRSHALGFETWQEAVTTLGTREWWLQAQGAGGNLFDDEALDNYMADEIGKTPPYITVANSRWVAEWNVPEVLPDVQAPVLFVRAEENGSLDRMNDDDCVSLVRDGREYIVPGALTGLVTYARPDEMATVVAQFIDEHSQLG
jgi:3-oxoadipate enol-lactonase/4-carboxymuconolactone decarboxylase